MLHTTLWLTDSISLSATCSSSDYCIPARDVILLISICACSPFLLPCALTACLGYLTSIINYFFMEETHTGLRDRSSKKYVPLESYDQSSHTENQPEAPHALSRALTSPNSVEISDCIGEAAAKLGSQVCPLI